MFYFAISGKGDFEIKNLQMSIMQNMIEILIRGRDFYTPFECKWEVVNK